MLRAIRCSAVFVVLFVVAAPASAEFYNVAGDINGWNPNDPAYLMTDMGGWWQLPLTGEAPGPHEFKVTMDGGWASNWPGSNAKAEFDGTGNLTINFYPGTQADGWSPAENRVGYDDPGVHGWDIMGSFNGWSAPVVVLTDQGGGMYSGQYTVPVAGDYEFKFRKEGDWGIAIGDDFGNSAANIPVTVAADGETILFELDLPGGRWRVPEPATWVMLLGLGAMFAGVLLRRRRR